MIHVKRIPSGAERSPVSIRYTLIAVTFAGVLCAFSLLAPGAFGKGVLGQREGRGKEKAAVRAKSAAAAFFEVR